MAYKVCSLATQFTEATSERIALLKQWFPNWRLHPFGGEIVFDSNNGKKSITLYNDGEVRLEYKREHESTILAWYGRNGRRRGVWRHIENKFAWINTCLGRQSFHVEYTRDNIRIDIEYSRLDNDTRLFVSTDWFDVADTKEKRVKVLVKELRFWNWRKAARKFVHWRRAKKSSEKDDDALERRWLHSLQLYQQCKEEKKKQ